MSLRKTSSSVTRTARPSISLDKYANDTRQKHRPSRSKETSAGGKAVRPRVAAHTTPENSPHVGKSRNSPVQAKRKWLATSFHQPPDSTNDRTSSLLGASTMCFELATFLGLSGCSGTSSKPPTLPISSRVIFESPPMLTQPQHVPSPTDYLAHRDTTRRSVYWTEWRKISQL